MRTNQVNVVLYDYQINESQSFSPSILNNVISYEKSTAWFDKPLVSFQQWIVHPITSHWCN